MMRQIVLLIVLFGGLILGRSNTNDQMSTRHFTVKKITEGVWAAINNTQTGGHAICNAGIVDLGDQVLVFDPFMNLDAASELKKVAKKLTGREVTMVINSHHHNDHIRGNQVFLPVSIVSTEWTRDQIALKEPAALSWEKENAQRILDTYKTAYSSATEENRKALLLWIGYFEGMVKSGPFIKTTTPNVTFNDSMWVYGKSRRAKLLEFHDGHTLSDIALFLPDDGVIFMGDLFFNDAHPWLAEGDPVQLQHHLQKVLQSGARQFIPGHGNVGDAAAVHNMIRYISDIRELVAEKKKSGLPDSLILRSAIPAQYADWTFGRRFYEPNLDRMIQEKY